MTTHQNQSLWIEKKIITYHDYISSDDINIIEEFKPILFENVYLVDTNCHIPPGII